MTISDRLSNDPEYVEAMLQLIEHVAESTRLEAEELHEAGFVPCFVRGAPTVIWLRWDGYFTQEAALAEVEDD